MIRIGPAGWSYADWRGRIHAPGRSPAAAHGTADSSASAASSAASSSASSSTSRDLDGLLDVFACVEVNVSFYRDPPPAMQAAWLACAARHEHARLPLKLHRRFTHELPALAKGSSASRLPASVESALDRELALWRAALAPWLASPQRGPLLVQFPFSFAPGARERRYLDALLERLPEPHELQVAVELRRREWFDEPARSPVLARGVSLVAIDLPHHPLHPDPDATCDATCDATADATAEATAEATALASAHAITDGVHGPIGYLRFHGRNARTWFARGATRDERYDHLYSPDEIEELAQRVRRVAARLAPGSAPGSAAGPATGSAAASAPSTPDVYVITNNHFEGKAVANAVELLAALGQPPTSVPARWVEHFPRLAGIAPTRGQGRLF